MSVVVGVDPSLACTGIAIIDLTTGEIETRRVITPSLGTSLRGRRDRMRRAIAGILAPIPPRVAVSVIEVPFASKQYGAHDQRLALYWWLVDQLLARGPVVEAKPSQRAKLATGNGNASKDDVVAAMRAQHPDARIPDDNVADALALAAAGARWAGTPITFTPDQEVAFARLSWPDLPPNR